MDDKKTMDTIRKILIKGGNVEIKMDKYGNIVVYEVKKNKVAM